jgi:hypothetical protein
MNFNYYTDKYKENILLVKKLNGIHNLKQQLYIGNFSLLKNNKIKQRNIYTNIKKDIKNIKDINFKDDINKKNLTSKLIVYSVRFKNLSFNYILDFKLNNIDISIPNYFNSSSSTIIKNKNEENYILNVRCVNYNININGKSSIKKNEKVLSSNAIITLDSNFKILDKVFLHPEINDNIPYIGVEDVRLFNFQDKIYFIGSSFDKNSKKVKIISDEYKTHENFNINFIEPNFETNYKWEKNWVLFENNNQMLVIYKWFPIYICQIDYLNKKLNLVKQIETPDIFSDFRGSTNGVLFDNKIWFIVHSQMKIEYKVENKIEKKIKYNHNFVVLNKDLTIYGYSDNFNFENYLIEYCIGMELSYNNNFIITYSTLDKTTKLAVFNPNLIYSLIKII